MPVAGVAAGADGSSMRNIWSSHLYSHRHRLSHILERNFPCGLGGSSRVVWEEPPVRTGKSPPQCCSIAFFSLKARAAVEEVKITRIR